MLRHLFTPLMLINQLALVVLLAVIIGVVDMAISACLVGGVWGSAHMISKTDSLRMQSYWLPTVIPLNESDQRLVADMTATVFSPELQNSARRDGREQQLKALQQYWQQALAPGMQRAVNQAEVAQGVTDFVDRIDQLVTTPDHITEQRIERVVWIHRILVIGTALLLIFTIIWLRARPLRLWKQLLGMVWAVSQRDFTQRVHISGRNEMVTLDMTLNNTSEKLAESHAVLGWRVQEKTAGLEQKNEILALLWQASRWLHVSAPLYGRISSALNGLRGLALLHDIEAQAYDLEDEDNHQEFTYHSDDECDDKGYCLCPCSLSSLPDGGTTPKRRLSDVHNQYDVLPVTLPVDCHLSHDQQQLVDTLMEQPTSTLALDRHQEKQQQLIVMEKRATIVRELHDFIAQSLSCMKTQASCLQMQGDASPAESRQLSGQTRNELNTFWVQLHELLTIFRLQSTEPKLCPALEASCQEYSARFGLMAQPDYQLLPCFVPSYQVIHLLQIAYKASSDTLKHASATEVIVTMSQRDSQARLVMADDGHGILDHAERSNHYGLIIMRDHVQSLCGDRQVRHQGISGTEVIATFIPEKTFLTQ